MTSFHPNQPETHKPYVDPLTRSYETYKPSGIGNPIKHREYKPNNVGIYGEKRRERKVKTPPRKPIPKPRTFVKKPREPVVRFQHYGKPTGPDIRLDAMGPDYKPPPHKPTTYKPSQPLVFENAFKEDPLRHRASYMAKYKPSEASRPQTYRLTEENHAPYRFWKFGHVTDTVTSGPQDVVRTQQTVKHLPQETKTKKTLRNSSTQSTSTVTKNVPTQTNNNNNRAAMTQTTPLPPVHVVPVTAITKEANERKRNQKTIGTQYSPPNITPVYTNQWPPNESQQTTPVAKGTPSPRHVTPHEDRRRSPSPPVAVFVPVVASSRNRQSPVDQRTKTPVQAPPDDLQRRTPSPLVPVYAPIVASQPPNNHSEAPSSWEPANSFTSGPTQSRLPPEISAHIEAYDFVHTHGEARSSIQRTMRFI